MEGSPLAVSVGPEAVAVFGLISITAGLQAMSRDACFDWTVTAQQE